jgi:hypothetical protein
MCTFDPHANPGVTTCSWKTVHTSQRFCFAPGQSVYFVDVWRSTRTYRGNVVLRGLNGVTVTGDFGDPPLLLDAIKAWNDAIYARVARSTTPIVSQNFGESRFEGTVIMVADSSCP